ncbi:hypothetical protein SH139x_005476 [Planctomycetaceae bacterium SH139]
MRLTLRTLLAFLDRTLEPADEQALGEKVESSSIASALVKRIREVMSSPTVGAPVPDAVGPTDDPNAIAEYLDDTLAPELTADVERQCVASDAQLAEVAASHQILAIVLGEPAEVPTELRQRVYQLRAANAAAGPEAVTAIPELDEAQAAAAGLAGATQVPPVGPADSGVAEAATRMAAEPDLHATFAAARKTLRKNQAKDPSAAAQGQTGKSHAQPDPSSNRAAARRSPASAGDRSRERLEAIGPLLSGGRPSRVTPWLVALGLAAAFLFVAKQTFAPLSENRQRRMADQAEAKSDAEAKNSLAEQTPQALVPNSSNNEPTAAKPEPQPAPANAPPPAGSQPSAEPQPATTQPQPATDSQPANESQPTVDPEPTTEPRPTTQPQPPVADASNASAEPPVNPLDAAIMAGQPSANAGAENDANGKSASFVLGAVEDDGGLLMTQDPATGQWNRLSAERELSSGQVLGCPPTYRARLLLDGGLEVNVIGPCAVRLNRLRGETVDQPGSLMLTVDFGRLVIVATRGPVGVQLATPSASGRYRLTAAGTAVAMSVAFQRPPGANPLEGQNSMCVTDLVSLQGRGDWFARATVPGQAPTPVSLNTGQSCRLLNGMEPQRGLISAPLQWTNPAPPAADSPEVLAQQGLAEFVNGEQPLEVSLREAIGFRTPAVSALAARTLVHLGMVDVMFGPQGVLSQPEHFPHWPLLVGDLRAVMNRGPQAAALIGAAVGEFEGEAAGKVWGLLTGFSPEQLKRGGDAVLIELLDDPVMSVRVLATETLREIIGETMNYRPDYEPAVRRNKVLRDIQRRQRRGQIVWNDPLIAAQGRPRIDGSY